MRCTFWTQHSMVYLEPLARVFPVKIYKLKLQMFQTWRLKFSDLWFGHFWFSFLLWKWVCHEDVSRFPTCEIPRWQPDSSILACLRPGLGLNDAGFHPDSSVKKTDKWWYIITSNSSLKYENPTPYRKWENPSPLGSCWRFFHWLWYFLHVSHW